MSADLQAQSHETLAVHSRTFSFAAKLLPPDARDDAAIVYSLCRLMDDLADDPPDGNIETAREDLQQLDGELTGLRQPRPLVAAFLATASRRNIDISAARALLQGVKSDLDPFSIDADDALLHYAWQVAGTVGLMMAPLLGTTDPTALRQAADLGIAMQITNICRDVREDAARGRVYLPTSRLTAHGVRRKDILSAPEAPTPAVRAGVQKVVDELLMVAEQKYESGIRGLAALPFRCRMSIAVAAALYRAIGHKLQRKHQSDPFHGRTIVSTAEKVGLAVSAVFAEMGRWIQGRPAPTAHAAPKSPNPLKT